MEIVSAHKTDVGLNKYKQTNEDFIWVNKDRKLYIVADGMGGLKAGEVASKLAATTAGQFITAALQQKTQPIQVDEIRALLIEAAEAANQTVRAEASRLSDSQEMGTTLVIALVQVPQVYICHAGDSRAYLVHNGTLSQLTEDDSWGNFIQKSTGADPEKASNLDNILTKAVGQEARLDPSFSETTVSAGDSIVLCSDGLWKMIGDERILTEVIQAGADIEHAVTAMVNAANEAGGKDNITVVLIRFSRR